ncbi:hypothetical protein HanPSC8_Chr04g0135611 [Helianthus annuus]|nr:hypothetical protein HanPSC8_Chr04g0135611 [Helianthus annuus]
MLLFSKTYFSRSFPDPFPHTVRLVARLSSKFKQSTLLDYEFITSYSKFTSLKIRYQPLCKTLENRLQP